MRKKKIKPICWGEVIKQKRKIILAMAVARVTDNRGVVTDRETWERNGGVAQGGSYHSDSPVDYILSYTNIDRLPQCWIKLIAEFAKPFIKGLTKKNAIGIYNDFIRSKRGRNYAKKRRIELTDQATMTRKHFGEDVYNNHYRDGILYDTTKKPITLSKLDYIDYLRRRFRDPEFTKKFVDKYVILACKGKILTEFLGVYHRYDLMDEQKGRFEKAVRKYGVTIFADRFSIDRFLGGKNVGCAPTMNVVEMIEQKAKKYGITVDLHRNIVMVKRRNKLYLVIL